MNLSLYFLYVSAAISGFSEFAVVLMVGAMSYIADISTKEERAFRMGENIYVWYYFFTTLWKKQVSPFDDHAV